MSDRFKFPYPGDELDMIEDLADEVYDNFPYTIAYTLDEYEQYLEQENYFRAFRRYIDFFEISVQYSTSLILSILKHRKVPFDDVFAGCFHKDYFQATGHWRLDQRYFHRAS
jgi:hypothetical protein